MAHEFEVSMGHTAIHSVYPAFQPLCVCVSVCVQKRESGPQELELQEAAGNSTWVLHRGRRYSLLLSHLFTFLIFFLHLFIVYIRGWVAYFCQSACVKIKGQPLCWD